MVDTFNSLDHDSTKSKVKTKLAIGKSILKLAEFETFKAQLYEHLIELIRVEKLVACKNQDVHSVIIQIITRLLEPKSAVGFIVENHLEIFKSITALIHHDDSGISQKAIKIFMRIFTNINEVNP